MKDPQEVNIPMGTDLNQHVPQPPQQTGEEDTTHSDATTEFPPMDEDIFDDLPPLLSTPCYRLQDAQDQELFLMGALGVLSGMLPNLQGKYFGREVGANLYCFVIGKYGTGKGALLWARTLGEAVDRYRNQCATDSKQAYEAAQESYQRQQRLYEKGTLPAPPIKPLPPKHLKLYLPANSTKTALMQLLQENDGCGIIFETEGDTLADMLRQDYGNFSDVLRKAFHHEPVSYFRRANNEDVTIPRPRLSVVLSGTHDQLRRLIPTIENGLFSRFCFYILQGRRRFKNPFDEREDDHQLYFDILADRLLKIYQSLDARETPLWFALQPHQQQEFVRIFDQQKEEIQEHISDDLEGTANRMGLIAFRIAMILTALRFPTALSQPEPERLLCLDKDFHNAVRITERMMEYSMDIYKQLPEPKRSVAHTDELDDREKKIKECCSRRLLGMSYVDIAKEVLSRKTQSTTVYKWVKRFCPDAA